MIAIQQQAESGVALSLETLPAKMHDCQVWDELLHGEETSVWADLDYVSAEREAAFFGPGKTSDFICPSRNPAGNCCSI